MVLKERGYPAVSSLPSCSSSPGAKTLARVSIATRTVIDSASVSFTPLIMISASSCMAIHKFLTVNVQRVTRYRERRLQTHPLPQHREDECQLTRCRGHA